MIKVSIQKKNKIKKEQGFILIAVLLMVSVLSAFIIEFNYESRVKFRLADNFNLAAQALNNADAGIAISIAALNQNENMLDDENAMQVFSGTTQIPSENGFCKISVTSESGKININALCDSAGKPVRKKVDQMLRLIDLLNEQYKNNSPISYSIVPSIIDWTDSDDDVTILPYVKIQNSGAEKEYYKKLDEPYHCKNAPFDLLSELLLIKGMTREIFYGRTGNERTGTKTIDGINQFLTVYGDGKININEAPITIIRSLSEHINLTLAQNIIEQRKFSRYSSMEQLKQVPGMTGEIFEEIRDLITVNTNENYYTVTATGSAEEMQRTVRVVLNKNPSTSRIEIVMRSEI